MMNNPNFGGIKQNKQTTPFSSTPLCSNLNVWNVLISQIKWVE